MVSVKVPLAQAEKVKTFLLEKKLLDTSVRLDKDQAYLYFAVLKTTGIKAKFPKVQFVKHKHVKSQKLLTMKEHLEGKLTKKEMGWLKTAHDTVGNIVILEIEEPLRKKEKLIATALLESNPAIKTVLRKEAKHDGVFRTQKLKWLAGKRTKESEYQENNIRLVLDVEKVYFSPRLATERKRIAGLVKKGEDVLVMFSGCAPYPCVIGKNSPAKTVVGVEINPDGHRYAEQNVKKNKLTNVSVYNGDVRKVVPTLKKKFDRILMPLPKSAEDFLDVALKAAKPGCTIHFYDFLNETEIPQVAVAKIKAACTAAGKKSRILRHVKCGQFGPGIFRICVDVVIR